MRTLTGVVRQRAFGRLVRVGGGPAAFELLAHVRSNDLDGHLSAEAS
jgi:hypothetical protein